MVNSDYFSSNFTTYASYLEQNWPSRIEQRYKGRDGAFCSTSQESVVGNERII